ncbi:type IV secretion system protein [Kribbella deserti]|uniref:Type IV secretion system protein n=1 Tax=Kribbella deserti TaxID=1926257 RepID=A0ABV6QL68_9ACTN
MIVLGCSLTNWGDCLEEFLSFAVSKVLGGLLDIILKAIKWVVAEAVKLVLETIGTFWIRLPTISLTNDGQASSTITFVEQQTVWLVAAIGVVSVILAGARMAWHGRGEPLRELGKSLGTLLVVSSAGITMVTLLTQLADSIARDVINASLGASGQTFAERMADLVVNPMVHPSTGLAIVLMFGLIAIISSFIQVIFMLVRSGMLILLAGVLPLAAAATNTEMGKAWFKRVVGWLVAFIVYKPVVALIYATALNLAGNPEGDMMKIITGVTMMLLAVIALPALLRFVAPKGA